MINPYTEHEFPLPYQEDASRQTQAVYQPTQTDSNQYTSETISQLPVTPPISTKHSSGSSGRVRTGAIIALTLLLAVVFGVGLFAGWQFGRTSTVTTKSSTTTTSTTGTQSGTSSNTTISTLTGADEQAIREAVIAKVRPTVVQINVTLQRGTAIGSGVIIDKRGYIVTNNHVVSGAQSIEVVLYDGTHLTAQLVGTDATDDLAVVKITTQANLTVATFGDSSKLQVGQDVLAIGNPLGITQTVTNGMISALGRSVSEGQNAATITNAIQTDAAINPGNSGGALVDLQGNLIGIPTLGAIDTEFNTPANGVGFAIPSNLVKTVVSQIIASGTVTQK